MATTRILGRDSCGGCACPAASGAASFMGGVPANDSGCGSPPLGCQPASVRWVESTYPTCMSSLRARGSDFCLPFLQPFRLLTLFPKGNFPRRGPKRLLVDRIRCRANISLLLDSCQ